MSDEYDKVVVSGKLKLKTDGDSGKKKKKKHKKEKDKLKKDVQSFLESQASSSSTAPKAEGRKLTKAEAAFKQMQDKTQKKRILEKASMTHKQRVESFNQHLDSLTEHFDIPKVSWTK